MFYKRKNQAGSIIKRLFHKLTFSLLNIGVGRHAFFQYLLNNPDIAIKALQEVNKKTFSDINLEKLARPQNFEDLFFLFSCNKSNRGIARLNFDEAAYLFSLARFSPSKKMLEVGRFTGGSTLLLAVALPDDAVVFSLDNAPYDDAVLKKILDKFNLTYKVKLIVADSRTYKINSEELDLIFIDGDHSYEGVRGDYNNFKGSLRDGGHLLFHDYNSSQAGVVKLINEIREHDQKEFTFIELVGSVAHFKKNEQIYS